MNSQDLKSLLTRVRDNTISVDQAVQELQLGPFKKSMLPFAEPDHHRRLRHGLAEVVFGESKSAEQVIHILKELDENRGAVLVTRLDQEKASTIACAFPAARCNYTARTLTLNPPAELTDFELANESFVAILAAGTVDLPVAEEAAEVCIATSTPFKRIYDVGVAGIHRLIEKAQTIEEASALVVVAGMEGTLPGVVAGMFGKTIFAVPTSVGYGTGLGGLSALLTMLNSCAPGVTVSNIDNGFGAGFAACQVVRAIMKGKTREHISVS